MIFEDRKVIFLHVPKTGGNSIQDTLRDYTEDEIIISNKRQDGIERFELRNKKFGNLRKHSSLQEYKLALQNDFYKYQIFTTIRNPFDRLVSFYFSPHRGEVDFSPKEFSEFVRKQEPLENFLSIRRGFFNNLKPYDQVNYLKFENLGEDFKKLCRALHIDPPTLSHRNISKRLDYKECFDAKLKRWVEKQHRFEILIGNYKF
ncbi:Sulfotransferase family protein [Loktanella sp. DSM 29012]|uniref:sulfotransferase family 2 domain-containing protein n=1 Tax=Loktanella sp. DSM 29012 TaxID=1881056 RepID=UPI0008AB37EF|nr:sulfotransferase family 2 domain-containing protein [Loktanella sp. DSM 29012]SEQ77829.1 Sulfotransferase family protein [Loktanella sp. DSM 29012]